jgi:hypothetical protein
MNITWCIEWWVRLQTHQWHYEQMLDEEDEVMKEIHLLLMLDNIRDGLWHKLGVGSEKLIEGVYENG